eukprot:s74_g15.t1
MAASSVRSLPCTVSSQQSSTPGHADPRTPSPATRVVQTKSRPVPRPLQPMAVTHRSAQAIEQGSGSMRRVVTVVRQPGSPLGQGRVSVSPVRQLAQAPNSQNVSPVASAQAMSPHSAAHVLAQGQNGSGCSERARPPQPGPSIPAVAAMGVGTSPSGAPLPPNAELCEGAVLPISSGGTCRVKKPLGMGSFGAVWEAEQILGDPIAVQLLWRRARGTLPPLSCHGDEAESCGEGQRSISESDESRGKSWKTIAMSPGERGCCASHLAAWRKCAKSGKPLLVLEDDAVILPSFTATLTQALKELPKDTGALWLTSKDRGSRKRVGQAIMQPHYLWTTVGYIIWPAAAKAFMRLLPMDMPVDNFMAWHVKDELQHFGVWER